MGDIYSEPPLVRIHSQCLTGDVFHSMRCDCRQQLELALTKISELGRGILIYEEQEGRGIGLMAKLQAYELQDQGLDTVEANVKLGYEVDCRGYHMPVEILKALGVRKLRLLSNNPEKVDAVQAAGIEVVERVPADVEAYESNAKYIRTKREKMGHFHPLPIIVAAIFSFWLLCLFRRRSFFISSLRFTGNTPVGILHQRAVDQLTQASLRATPDAAQPCQHRRAPVAR